MLAIAPPAWGSNLSMQKLEPEMLEYERPQKDPDRWRETLFVFLFGPLICAMNAGGVAAAAVCCWVWNDEPSFYFHGWWDARAGFVLWTLCGALIGLGYGLVLSRFEQFSRRRIRLEWSIPVTVLLGFAIALEAAVIEFQVHEIWFLVPEAVSAVVGLVISYACSRRVENDLTSSTDP